MINKISYISLLIMKSEAPELPIKIAHWKVIKKIGQGSFGCIYSAESTSKEEKDKQYVAIKTELITNIKQMLLLEYQVYKEFQGVRGFPRVIEYIEQQRLSYLVMEQFQMSLDKYAMSRFPKQFVPANTLLQMMIQTLKIIRKIHEKGYLYRDIKPANFMLKSPYQQIFIIDFGLCKKYVNNNRHIPMKTNKKLVGTPLFCSLNTHIGLEQSRRDDIQSWLWASLFFSLQLPWECVMNKKELSKDQQYEQIYKIKKETKWQPILKSFNSSHETKIPNCILKLIQYVRKVEFEEQPDYDYMEKLISNEYYCLYNTPLSQFVINWEAKASSTDFTEKDPINDANQDEKNEIPRKIKKINFKAPIKSKVLTKSEHPRQEADLNKNFLAHSN